MALNNDKSLQATKGKYKEQEGSKQNYNNFSKF